MRVIVLSVLLGVACGLWETAFAPFLPSGWLLRPLLPVVVLSLLIGERRAALGAAIGGSIFFDLFMVSSSDVAILRWVLLVFVLDLLLNQWLTNRSLYVAVAMAFFGRVFERATAWMFSGMGSWVSSNPYGFGSDPIWWVPFVWDLALVTAGFFLFAFFTKRFLEIRV